MLCLHGVFGAAGVLLGEFEQHFLVKELVDGHVLGQTLRADARGHAVGGLVVVFGDGGWAR